MKEKLEWLTDARQRVADNVELDQVVEGLETFAHKDKRKYAHFIDGGITDNLGLRAIYEIVEVAGGAAAFMQSVGRDPPRHLVVISVNASTDPEPKMDLTNEQPSLEETINAVSSAQLHRYNAATLELMDETLPRWAEELVDPGAEGAVTFHPDGVQRYRQAGSAAVFQPDPDQFRPHGRAGGQTDRCWSQADPRKSGLPESTGRTGRASAR